VARAELRGYDDPPALGRHRELSADCEQDLVEWLANKAANHRTVNWTELLHECTERFEKSIKRGWVDPFITRHAHELFEVKSIPQENPRLEVPRVFLEAAIDGFRDHVHNACAGLLFNFDEIGVNKWEDRSERRVIAPSTMRGQTIYYAVHRNLKHISVVACIAAAGEHMTLFLLTGECRRGEKAEN
jgi:hypothetical protein